MQEAWIWSPGLEDALEEEIAVYFSILTLAWRIPWTEEPGGYSPKGWKELDTIERLKTTAYSIIYLAALFSVTPSIKDTP